MDKELLRIVIFATGLLIMIGMMVWAFVKNKRYRQSLDDFEDEESTDSGRHRRAANEEDEFIDEFDNVLSTAPAALNGKSGRYRA